MVVEKVQGINAILLSLNGDFAYIVRLGNGKTGRRRLENRKMLKE